LAEFFRILLKTYVCLFLKIHFYIAGCTTNLEYNTSLFHRIIKRDAAVLPVNA